MNRIHFISDRCFYEGAADQIKGIALGANPYPEDSAEHDCWDAGWKSAYAMTAIDDEQTQMLNVMPS